MKFLIILGLLCLIPVGAYAIPPDGSGIPPTHAFSKIIVDGLTELTSKKYNDSLNIESGTNITIDANTTTNTITINSSGGGGATQLNDLTDVIISSPLTNEILIYNGSEWVNDSNPGAASQLNDLTDVNAVGCSDEQVLEYDTGTSKWICGIDDVGTGGSFDKTNIAYINETNAWNDGITQTFNPNGTNSGLNVGVTTGNISNLVDGDLYYDDTGVGSFRVVRNGGIEIVLTQNQALTIINKILGSGTSFSANPDMGTNQFMGSMSCSNGQILEYNSGSNTWTCGTDDTGGGGGATLGFSGAGSTVAKGATSYLGWGTGGVQSAEADAEIKIGHAATISNLYCYVVANSTGADGNTITIRHNGAGTTLQVTFDTGVTGWQSDLTGSYSVSAGDTLSIEVINTGSGGGSKNLTVGSCSVDMS